MIEIMQFSPLTNFVESLLYGSNFKKVNLWISSHFTKPDYGIYRYDWDFTTCLTFDPFYKRYIRDQFREEDQNQHFDDAWQKNQDGHDLYWMPNTTSLPGIAEPKAEEITHARALYVDIDQQLPESDLLSRISNLNLPPPSIYFNTLKGWQVFWIFNKALLIRRKSKGEIQDLKALDSYLEAQEYICTGLEGDKSCLNLNRKMRVPNTLRWKGDPLSTFCKGNTERINFYRFEDFSISKGTVRKAKVKAVQVEKEKIDVSKPVTMDDFNSLVDGYDFKSLLGISKMGKCRCPFPENHQNGDKHPSAIYGFRHKFKIACTTCRYSYDVRDLLKRLRKLSDQAIFEYLKGELGVAGIIGQESEIAFTRLNGTFQGFQDIAKGYKSYQGMNGLRLVCSVLYHEALESLKRGKAAFTISTNHLTENSGMTKMATVGLTNMLVYFGIVRKTINPTIQKWGRGISEFEFMEIDPEQVKMKIDKLISLKMNNPERFNEKWVMQNIGMEAASAIYQLSKVVITVGK